MILFCFVLLFKLNVQVILKIIKHAHEETIEAAQGGLLGLVKDSTLEVTNCFPFPNQNKPENADLGSLANFSLEKSIHYSLHIFRSRTISEGHHA